MRSALAISIHESTDPSVQRAPGRPRSETCRSRILSAVDALLDESGFSKTSIDAIALRAGVSKATIYRWWPNKAAVVMEAILAATEADIFVPDSPSPQTDIAAKIRRTILLFRGPKGTILASLIAEAQSDPEIADAYRKLVMVPRRAAMKRAIERAIQAGAFQTGIDIELAIDMIYGPLYERLLLKHAPFDAAFERDYPAVAIAALQGYAQLMGR